MCTSLAKFFSCVQAAEEYEERDRCQPGQDRQPGYNFDRHHRQQLMALSNLSAGAMAQRRRNVRPKQPPPPLPLPMPADAEALPSSRKQRERERDSCNSYTAMERHDQIVEVIGEQLQAFR